MDFWSGVSGTEEAAFLSGFGVIPDKTMAVSSIVHFQYMAPQGREPHYEIKWKIIDGPYKNRNLWQKINAFSPNGDKALRAKNMMMLLFKSHGISPVSGRPPSNEDLLAFQGKVSTIQIMVWTMARDDGTIGEGNWVSEVHAANYVAPTETIIPAKAESAFDRNPRPFVGGGDVDLPF